MRAQVYFNLHSKLWSIKALEGPHKGRVIGHCTALYLADVEFKVSEAGRQRVLRERRKNVHAYAIGRITGVAGYVRRLSELQAYRLSGGQDIRCGELVTYNPYKAPLFHLKHTPSLAVTGGSMALLTGDRAVRVWNAHTEAMAVAATGDLFGRVA